MKFYYLHIQAGEVDDSLEAHGACRIDFLPKDPMFQSDGFWGLPAVNPIVEDKGYKITCKKVTTILISENIADNHLVQPEYLLKLDFAGIPMVDHFGLYNKAHLVVSEMGLSILRDSGIHQAEADLISGSIESYFDENRHLFWMPDQVRKKFIEKFAKST